MDNEGHVKNLSSNGANGVGPWPILSCSFPGCFGYESRSITVGVAGPLKFQLNQHEVVGDTIFLRAHTGNHIAGVLEWDELVQSVTQNDEPQIVPHHTV